jgi:hypothetical protein
MLEKPGLPPAETIAKKRAVIELATARCQRREELLGSFSATNAQRTSLRAALGEQGCPDDYAKRRQNSRAGKASDTFAHRYKGVGIFGCFRRAGGFGTTTPSRLRSMYHLAFLLPPMHHAPSS